MKQFCLFTSSGTHHKQCETDRSQIILNLTPCISIFFLAINLILHIREIKPTIIDHYHKPRHQLMHLQCNVTKLYWARLGLPNDHSLYFNYGSVRSVWAAHAKSIGHIYVIYVNVIVYGSGWLLHYCGALKSDNFLNIHSGLGGQAIWFILGYFHFIFILRILLDTTLQMIEDRTVKSQRENRLTNCCVRKNVTIPKLSRY